MRTEVSISGEKIRLGQLLKLAGVAGSGSEAKAMLAAGEVRVNGERETRRGRQLVAGDEVLAAEESLLVTTAHAPGAPPA